MSENPTPNNKDQSQSASEPHTSEGSANGGIISDEQKQEIETLVSKTLDLDLQQALETHDQASRLKIIKQWHLWKIDHKRKIIDSGWDFSAAIKNAFYDSEDQTKENALSAAEDLASFEMMSHLVRVMVQPNYLHKNRAGQTLEFLARVWFRLCNKTENSNLPDLKPVVSYAVTKQNPQVFWPANQAHLRKLLEESVNGFFQHKRQELVVAFFLVLDYTDVVLKRGLQNDSHSAHVPLMDLLGQTEDPVVLEKLAGFVGTRSPSNFLVNIWRRREDLPFIHAFLDQIENSVPSVVSSNFRRMGQPDWLLDQIAVIADHTVERQTALLKLAQVTITDQDFLLEQLLRMMTAAALPVQRLLVKVLCTIQGSKATQVIEYLLDNQSDPEIITILIPQIRKRNLHGAMKKLLAFLDHHDESVKQAAGESFGDCTIKRYLQAFDMLNEKVRVSTGQLVSKVDPNVCRVLLEELTCPHKTLVLKALVALRYISRRNELESTVCDLAKSVDPKIRETVAETLGYIPTDEVQNTLRRLLADPDSRVQKAAERSLQFLSGL